MSRRFLPAIKLHISQYRRQFAVCAGEGLHISSHATLLPFVVLWLVLSQITCVLFIFINSIHVGINIWVKHSLNHLHLV